MDDTFPFVNEAASEQVGISLQDLSQHGHTGNGNTLLSRADEATTNNNPITRLNLDERTRRQLLEDVLGLLAQNSGSTERDKEYQISADSHTHVEQSDINQDMSSRPKMSTSQGQSGYHDSTSQSPTQQISNLLIPLKDGYKLDLRDMSSQNLPKNLKIKFDAGAQNLRVKNVMRDVAKYGDKYAKNRTATKGVLTVSILLQNIAQLKSVVKKGQTGSENFWFLVVLIPISLLIQIVGGALIIYVGNMQTETNEQIKSSYTLNRWILYVSSAASLLNTVIASLLLSE